MMKVIGKKVLIKEIKESENEGAFKYDVSSSTGISKATVLDKGQGVEECLKEGDTILFYTGSGKEFKNPTDDQKYRVISDSEVIVIL